MRIGFHASHEQLSPRALLDAVIRAEEAGFDAAMCSDHFAPWGVRQGQSGFAWTWLGAALASTAMPFGVVTAAGGRYHPAILAQAIATTAEMFPGRFWAALGSGEALNERVTGAPWPSKPERDRRLRSCAGIIRELLRGEVVSAESGVRVREARIWSLPTEPPPLRAAAVSPETAGSVAEWADGFITVAPQQDPPQQVRDAFRGSGGRGPAILQLHICLGESDEDALAIARDQWRHVAVPGDRMWELALPEQFDAFGPPDDAQLRGAVLVSGSASQLAAQIRREAEGFDEVYLHHVGQDQQRFLRRAQDELLPAIREAP